MARITNPESYVPKEKAAAFLRTMADEIESDADEQLICVTIDRRYASPHEISRALKEPECPCAHCRVEAKKEKG